MYVCTLYKVHNCSECSHNYVSNTNELQDFRVFLRPLSLISVQFDISPKRRQYTQTVEFAPNHDTLLVHRSCKCCARVTRKGGTQFASWSRVTPCTPSLANAAAGFGRTEVEPGWAWVNCRQAHSGRACSENIASSPAAACDFSNLP